MMIGKEYTYDFLDVSRVPIPRDSYFTCITHTVRVCVLCTFKNVYYSSE